MSNANQTTLAPVTAGFRVDRELPVIPFAMEVKHAVCATAHSHPRGQLMYASSGVTRVITEAGIWIVPPSQAVWVPPDVSHEAHFPGAVSLRHLFVDPSAAADLPPRCTVLQVSPLLEELTARAVTIGDDYRPSSPAYRLMLVLLDEIRAAPATKIDLPTSGEPRLARVLDALLERPEDPRDLPAWAAVAGASPRTLARLFQKETGMSYQSWRRRLALQRAVERLSQGASVTAVALDAGYASVSAFIAMFRKELGTSPARYARR